MSKCSIYVLKDPDTLEVKYVGKTKRSLAVRLSKHLSLENTGNEEKNNWIRSIVGNNKLPIIDEIESTTIEMSSERERYWVKYYKSQNANLLNINLTKKPTKTRTFRINRAALEEAERIHGEDLNAVFNEYFVKHIAMM